MPDLIQQLKESLDDAGLWEGNIALKRNDFLLREGSRDASVYYVEKGCLRLFLTSGVVEHTVRFAYAGNIMTALDCFISGNPTMFNVQAVRKTTLRSVSAARFREFMRSNPSMQQLWNQLLEALVYQQLERENDLLTVSPEERYRRVLERSPALFQEVPLKYIASYLRMTPETLSRIKKS